MRDDSLVRPEIPLLDVDTVAQFLNVSVMTVRREVQRGHLAAFKVGSGRTSKLRFAWRDVQLYLDQRRVS